MQLNPPFSHFIEKGRFFFFFHFRAVQRNPPYPHFIETTVFELCNFQVFLFWYLFPVTSSQENYEERRVRHEACHFLSGYLCGLPIKSYRAEGGTTLVEFYDSVDGDLGGRALKFTPEEVDKVRGEREGVQIFQG